MNDLQRALRRLVIATVGLYFVIAILGLFVWVTANSAANNADTSNTALCALRADLEQRVESGQKFLAEHPQGIEGISAADIQEGINNQIRTIQALSSLDCS